MSDKCFSYMYCLCCFGFVLTANTGLLIFSALFNNITRIDDLILTICLGVYYLIVLMIYLGLFGLIVRNSFLHVEKIISLKIKTFGNINNESTQSKFLPENVSQDTQLIFKHILLNLIFLLSSIVLNSYFDYIVVKVFLVLYICWTLGFTASLRVNESLCVKINSNQLKEYILLKSLVNTIIFVLLYFLLKYII
jgi:hypothetical protein